MLIKLLSFIGLLADSRSSVFTDFYKPYAKNYRDAPEDAGGPTTLMLDNASLISLDVAGGDISSMVLGESNRWLSLS